MKSHSGYFYSFGSPMPTRSWSSSSYRFGFNGKEKDNDINVDGGSYDYGARIYDSRLSRWLSIDPLYRKYTSTSPYCFAVCSPLIIIDKDGRMLYIAPEVKGQGINTAFRDIIQSELGDKVKIDITSGYVTLSGNRSELTSERAKIIYDALIEIINETETIYFSVSNNSNKVALGGYQQASVNGVMVNVVDLGDAKDAATDNLSATGFILHELYETYMDQRYGGASTKKDNSGYNKDHIAATLKQAALDGITIKDPLADMFLVKYTSPDKKTICRYGVIRYTKDGKTYTNVVKYDSNNKVVGSFTFEGSLNKDDVHNKYQERAKKEKEKKAKDKEEKAKKKGK